MFTSLPGTDNEGYKVPSVIAHDILLIQDLIGPVIPPTQAVIPLAVNSSDSPDSSDENTDSADEVEVNLLSVGVELRRFVSSLKHLFLQLTFS
jgi:hypothetical protein